MEQNGYMYHLFQGLYEENIKINKIKYYIEYNTILSSLDITPFFNCINSAFVVQNIKGEQINMLFKRVNNFNITSSKELFIMNYVKNNFKEGMLNKMFAQNYNVSEKEAERFISNFRRQQKQLEDQHKKQKIRDFKNSGFKIEIKYDSFSNKLSYIIDDIDNIFYLQLFNIYIGTLQNFFQGNLRIPSEFQNTIQMMVAVPNLVIREPEKEEEKEEENNEEFEDIDFEDIDFEDEDEDDIVGGDSSSSLELIANDSSEESLPIPQDSVLPIVEEREITPLSNESLPIQQLSPDRSEEELPIQQLSPEKEITPLSNESLPVILVFLDCRGV